MCVCVCACVHVCVCVRACVRACVCASLIGNFVKGKSVNLKTFEYVTNRKSQDYSTESLLLLMLLQVALILFKKERINSIHIINSESVTWVWRGFGGVCLTLKRKRQHSWSMRAPAAGPGWGGALCWPLLLTTGEKRQARLSSSSCHLILYSPREKYCTCRPTLFYFPAYTT